jgi:DNA-binding transcriptional ArsR family regulator
MSSQKAMDLVFHALAHPTRRHMMDLVKQSPGCSVNDLCEHFETSRISVMKHLGVLVDAKLILSQKRGRTRELFFNVAPIQMIHDRWRDEYSEFWATQMIDLKYQIEGKSKSKKSKSAKKRPAKKKPIKKGKKP